MAKRCLIYKNIWLFTKSDLLPLLWTYWTTEVRLKGMLQNTLSLLAICSPHNGSEAEAGDLVFKQPFLWYYTLKLCSYAKWYFVSIISRRKGVYQKQLKWAKCFFYILDNIQLHCTLCYASVNYSCAQPPPPPPPATAGHLFALSV